MLRRQAPQQVGVLDNVVALDIELQVPSKLVDALRQRLDHLPCRDGVRPAERKPDTADAAVVEALELRVRDRRMDDRDAARARAQLPEGIDGDAIVGRVVARLHHDDARRPGALLQQAIIRTVASSGSPGRGLDSAKRGS